MASYNRVILMGNLSRDPELRQSQKGSTVARSALAVNERVPDGNNGWREEVSFIDIVVFGQQADSFGRFFRKGKPCLVEGKLRQSKWQDKESGQNRSKLEVIVDRWHFVGGKEGGSAGSGGGSTAPAAAGEPAETSPQFPSADDFVPDDVPF
ncbi:MAG: single-stranded DNA-binding protein [Planctomycetota bacterium]|nr:MAG: single-stranded DNA-binding protein [Planctomycetota bacterium]